MESIEKNVNNFYVVDLSHVIRVIWRKIWVVAIASILVAVFGFIMAAFVIAPTYSSSIMLYVNNSSDVGSLGSPVNNSELLAAQSLAKTYQVLLKNRTALERVIDEAGVDYTWEEVYDMIDSSAVNETEVMQITVTCGDPEEAMRIANGIAKVLPQRISEIIDGASMEVVDSAIVNREKVGPSIATFTVIGFFVGAILSVLVLIVSALMDNTVHDDEYVNKTYDYPILAKVPNLLDGGTKKYGYYYSSYKKHNYDSDNSDNKEAK